MKIPVSLALAALAASSLFGQDLSGQWQGIVETARKPRMVVKFSQEGGAPKAVLYAIDQSATGIGASTVTVQSGTVKISVPAVSASFEGKLSADGNTLAGTWTQSSGAVPLTLVRATPATAWELPAAPPPLKPMAADADPAFEVATIKPSAPGGQGRSLGVRGRQFSTRNTSLRDLIIFSYELHPKQVTGHPEWVESERYDLAGQPDAEGQPNDKQWKAMIRKLLADRFKLVFHREQKELSVYAVTVAKTGPKLTPSQGNPNGLPTLRFSGPGVLPARNATMNDLARTLQAVVLDRPVVDRTGLTGRFDFTLRWTPDEFQFQTAPVRMPPPSDSPDAPPDLYTAVQQQLGLKIEGAKAMTEVFVIEKVEKPSAN